jgi:hypothetical protein
MTIDLTSFSNAIAQWEEALDYAASDLAASDPRLARHLRAGAIQAFEFTYELSFKTLRRYLEPPIPARAPSRIWISPGWCARGLLSPEVKVWRKFREDRGTTSHAYDNDKAQQVFCGTPGPSRGVSRCRSNQIVEPFHRDRPALAAGPRAAGRRSIRGRGGMIFGKLVTLPQTARFRMAPLRKNR